MAVLIIIIFFIVVVVIIINGIYRAQTSQAAANAPSQLLHGNSYSRTGTFSVVSGTLAVKCLADGSSSAGRQFHTMVRKRQNWGLRSLITTTTKKNVNNKNLGGHSACTHPLTKSQSGKIPM